MSLDHRDGSTRSFFFNLNNETSLVLMKHEVLVFKVFSGDLQKPSHFNSRIPTFDLT